MSKSYDYATREGIHRLSWDEIGALTRELAERVAEEQPDLIVGVARAGLIPAAAVAAALRLDLTPVRLSRRRRDRVVHDEPVWLVPLAESVEGRRVVVVDDIADTGRTLAAVSEHVLERGAAHVGIATLVAHSWADPRPGAVALVTDALLVFPWDAEVYVDGVWGPHPELEDAIKQQDDA